MSNIWDIASKEVEENKKKEKNSERYVLFAGSSSCGKTTSIMKFLSRDDATNVKPTTALEYTFARKSANTQNKMTGHIWELGGGTHLTKLIEIPINPDTIQSLTIVLVVDLSQPEKMWSTLETLINTTKEKVDLTIKLAGKRNPEIPKVIKSETKQRFDKKGMDNDEVQPFPIPLIIVGSKYDLFQNMDFEEKKLIQGALRCIAHCNGATLLFTSSKIESTLKVLRHVLNVATFDAKINKNRSIEEHKPIYVPFGQDSVEDIGNPPKSLTTLHGSRRNFQETWKSVFCNHFKQQVLTDESFGDGENPVTDKQYFEAKVDECRTQKDRILEAYKKQESQKWTSRIS